MKSKIPVFLFGASGHCKVVIDIIERQGLYGISGIFDDNPFLKEKDFYGYTVFGGRVELLNFKSKVNKAIVTIGNNSIRRTIAAYLLKNGFKLASAIHPSAEIGRGVVIGAGTVVMANAVINSDTKVGTNVIVNTKASIDHDCIVMDDSHIAPGATLCGTVTVGHKTFVGAGATVIPNLSIGDNVMVAAGATVVNNIPAGITVAGTPARPLINIDRSLV